MVAGGPGISGLGYGTGGGLSTTYARLPVSADRARVGLEPTPTLLEDLRARMLELAAFVLPFRALEGDSHQLFEASGSFLEKLECGHRRRPDQLARRYEIVHPCHGPARP